MQTEAIKNILDDQSFKEVMEDIIAQHTQMFIHSDVDDKQTREICYLRIAAVKEILSHLESIAVNDKLKNKQWKI